MPTQCPTVEVGAARLGRSARWGSPSAQLGDSSLPPKTCCRGTCPGPPAPRLPVLGSNDLPIAALRYFLQKVKEKKSVKNRGKSKDLASYRNILESCFYVSLYTGSWHCMATVLLSLTEPR